jgi:hypothetical protein
VIPRRILTVAVLFAAALAGRAAGAPSDSALPGPALDLDTARLAQIDAARRYRESLESLRPLRENAVERRGHRGRAAARAGRLAAGGAERRAGRTDGHPVRRRQGLVAI